MAEHTPTTSRRRLLSAAPAALALAGAGIGGAVQAAPNPDAELIAVATEHVANVRAYNTDGGYLECEVDPLWHAYRRTMDALDNMRPQTLAGMASKIKAAEADADCEFTDTHAGRWAWDVMQAVLAMAGDVAGEA